jgi:hypothetical protein
MKGVVGIYGYMLGNRLGGFRNTELHLAVSIKQYEFLVLSVLQVAIQPRSKLFFRSWLSRAGRSR